jgi:hypothetical protein
MRVKTPHTAARLSELPSISAAERDNELTKIGYARKLFEKTRHRLALEFGVDGR